MEALLWVVSFLYELLATSYAAGVIGGLLILATERRARHRQLTQLDVHRTACMYRLHYGQEALRAIGDHMVGASFTPDSRHRQFLKRVSAELIASTVADDDRARASEHSDLASRPPLRRQLPP